MPIKENWYVLLSFAHFQQEDYGEVRDIHKLLLANWPMKRYWTSLAGTYAELGDQDSLFAAYDAVHTQGLLEAETELVTMAQLYMQHDVPYKAGVLLESEMKNGRVSRNANNYRLLSQAWSLAQEDERSIPALREAADSCAAYRAKQPGGRGCLSGSDSRPTTKTRGWPATRVRMDSPGP